MDRPYAKRSRSRRSRQRDRAGGNLQQVDLRSARKRERAGSRFDEIGVVFRLRFCESIGEPNRHVARNIHGVRRNRFGGAERQLLHCENGNGIFLFCIFYEFERAAREENSFRRSCSRAERVGGIDRQRAAVEVNAARHRVAHAGGERHVALVNRQPGARRIRRRVRQRSGAEIFGSAERERAVQIKHHSGGANRLFRERN